MEYFTKLFSGKPKDNNNIPPEETKEILPHETKIIDLLKNSEDPSYHFNGAVIDEKTIKELESWLHLKKITLENCNTLTNEQLRKIATATAETLEEIDIKGESQLSNEVWSALLPAKKLHSISLQGFFTIANDSLSYVPLLESLQKQLKKLNIHIKCTFLPELHNLCFPELEEFTGPSLSEKSITWMNKNSPHLKSISITDGKSVIQLLAPIPQVFEGQTTQICPPTIDGEGFAYFVNQSMMKKVNLADGKYCEKQLPLLSTALGSMLSVASNYAVIASNRSNTGITIVGVFNRDNDSIITTPVKYEKDRLVYNVNVGSFSEKTELFAYALVGTPDQLQMYIDVYPLNDQQKGQLITLPQGYGSPFISGEHNTVFLDSSTIAVLAVNNVGKSNVFYVDLKRGTVGSLYNPIPTSKAPIAITGGESYRMAVLAEGGQLCLAYPTPFNDNIEWQLVEMGNELAYDYRAITFFNPDVMVYFARDKTKNCFVVGLINVITQRHLNQYTLEGIEYDVKNPHVYMPLMKMLSKDVVNGELALTITPQNLALNQKLPNVHLFRFQVSEVQITPI
jgi:hypothetical protein